MIDAAQRKTLHRQAGMFKFLPFVVVLALAQFCAAAPVPFSSAQHGISATIPDGWDQVPAMTEQAVLKISRRWALSERARIVLMLQDIPPDSIRSDYDIWSMTDGELRQAAKSRTVSGEAPTVLSVGRELVAGVHMVWNKIRRKSLDNSTLTEFTYEGIRGSQVITIRLSSFGGEDWFAENEAAFAAFLQTLQISD